jgi:hypothetical protein
LDLEGITYKPPGGEGVSHNDEVHKLYISCNCVGVLNTYTVPEKNGHIKDACEVSSEKYSKGYNRELGTDGRIILKWRHMAH